MITSLALAPHEEVDLALRQSAQRLASGFLDFADTATRAIELKVWERFGYQEPQDYFEQRVRISYRTLRRWLSVTDGIRALPPAEREEARQAMAKLGSHKAGVLVPVLRRQAADWREWVEFAERATEDALQERVTEATGGRPRGGVPGAPGSRFLDFLLANVPPDRRQYVEAVVTALMKAAEQTNPIGAFMLMVDLAARDLADQGIEVEVDDA